MWAYIKKTINTNLNKALDILIAERANTTDGKIALVENVATAARNEAYSYYINELNYLARGSVKSIQRGVVVTNSGSITVTVPIASVNISKCLILLDGFFSASGTSSRNHTFERPGLPYVSIFLATSIVIGTSGFPPDSTTSQREIGWQIIEFY